MVAARGGITALESNWRLELAIFLCVGISIFYPVFDTQNANVFLRRVLLMSKPTWFDVSNQIWELSKPDVNEPQHPILSQAQNVLRIRSLWLISFVQDLRTFMSTPSSRLLQYPNIQAAMALLVADFQLSIREPAGGLNNSFTEHEFSRVACIFFICVLLQSVAEQQPPPPDNLEGRFDSTIENADSIIIIENVLMESRDQWQSGSTEALYNTLFHGVYDLPDKAKKMEYVLNLTSVLGQTSSEARRGVSKCLLHILYPNQANPHMVYRGDNWTPDSLLSSIHGL